MGGRTHPRLQIWDVVRRYREFCALDILVRPSVSRLTSHVAPLHGETVDNRYNCDQLCQPKTWEWVWVCHVQLREKHPSRAVLFPFLPSKKYIGSSLSADFVDKRQRDLGYYVSSILHSCPLVRPSSFSSL